MTEQQQKELHGRIFSRFNKAREGLKGYDSYSMQRYFYLKSVKTFLTGCGLFLLATAYVLTVLWFFPAIRLYTSDLEAWAFGLMVVLTGIPCAVLVATKIPANYRSQRDGRLLIQRKRLARGNQPSVSNLYLYLHHSSMKDSQAKSVLICMAFMLGMFIPLFLFLLIAGVAKESPLLCVTAAALILFCALQLTRAICLRRSRNALQQLWRETARAVIEEALADGSLPAEHREEAIRKFCQ